MLEYKSGNKTAIIVLHEIYGINDFVKEHCQQYHKEGYDIFCPNLFRNHKVFPYAKAEEAYRAFCHMVGFDAYQEINALATNLKQIYKKIIVLGFSVGATLAWRCSESLLYDGIICCYGSRIRDYLTVVPQCHSNVNFEWSTPLWQPERGLSDTRPHTDRAAKILCSFSMSFHFIEKSFHFMEKAS